MRLWEDGVVAALAVVGLVTMLYLFFSALLEPRRRCVTDAVLVLPCRGDGAELEQTVRRLLRLRSESGGFRRLVLLDCGLDAEAKQLAALLCRDGCGVCLCTREDWQPGFEESLH